MKKLLASLLAVTLLFSPIGNFIFDDPAVAEAKRYKSGKKNFNTNQNKPPTNSGIQKKKDDNQTNTVQKNKQTPPANKGGLMRGLMFGGLAGLLFGSLFANMGMLGSILGFMINIAAIAFVIFVLRKIFILLTKKQDEDKRTWNN